MSRFVPIEESLDFKLGRDYIKCFYVYLFDKPNVLSPLPCGMINHYFIKKIFDNYKRLMDAGNSVDESIEQAIDIPLMKAIFSDKLLKEARKFANNRKYIYMASIASIASIA